MHCFRKSFSHLSQRSWRTPEVGIMSTFSCWRGCIGLYGLVARSAKLRSTPICKRRWKWWKGHSRLIGFETTQSNFVESGNAYLKMRHEMPYCPETCWGLNAQPICGSQLVFTYFNLGPTYDSTAFKCSTLGEICHDDTWSWWWIVGWSLLYRRCCLWGMNVMTPYLHHYNHLHSQQTTPLSLTVSLRSSSIIKIKIILHVVILYATALWLITNWRSQ